MTEMEKLQELVAIRNRLRDLRMVLLGEALRCINNACDEVVNAITETAALL